MGGMEHMPNFIDNYINRAPLNRDAYTIDMSEVYMYITNSISGNNTIETKSMANKDQTDGRIDYINIMDDFDSVGINTIAIIEAEKVIDSLFYGEEKKSNMWWEEFEKKLTKAFVILDKGEDIYIYSDWIKLRTLTKKLNTDFIQGIRIAITIDLTIILIKMTYEMTLTALRDEVNRKSTSSLYSNPTCAQKNSRTSSWQWLLRTRAWWWEKMT